MSLKPNIKIGDRFETINCGWCTVVEYNLYSDIVIEFDAPYVSRKRVAGGALKRGNVFNTTQPKKEMRNCLKDTFYYDESSPSCLRWKVNKYSGNNHLKVQVSVGDVVGTLTSSGKGTRKDSYYMTRSNGKRLLCHRIVWELFNGEIQDKNLMIDHIDGNTLNSKISNLRLVSRTDNMRNMRKFKINSSGVTGVKLQQNTDRKGNPYYYQVAFWRGLDGREHHKCFSVSKFGREEAFRLACEYRAKMIEELNTQGAGYTDRHGK